MLKSKILFSIIIPHYNSPKLLKRCLNNLLNQKYNLSLYEVLVVDDGSYKKPDQIIKNYSSKFNNFSFYRYSVNKGPGYARNIGIKKSNGYYILFLDCDDSLENKALNKLTKIINKKKYDLISYDYKLNDFREKKNMRNDINI